MAKYISILELKLESVANERYLLTHTREHVPTQYEARVKKKKKSWITKAP